jgi:hypothetical protein
MSCASLVVVSIEPELSSTRLFSIDRFYTCKVTRLRRQIARHIEELAAAVVGNQASTLASSAAADFFIACGYFVASARTPVPGAGLPASVLVTSCFLLLVLALGVNAQTSPDTTTKLKPSDQGIVLFMKNAP